MPLQKRLPKYGFSSRIARKTGQIRLGELSKVQGDGVTVDSLREAGLIHAGISRARIFLSGELTRQANVRGVAVTKGAKSAIEAAGGSVEA